MVMFWVAILAVSLLLYVLLDGFDLGVGILFGRTGDEARRHAMLVALIFAAAVGTLAISLSSRRLVSSRRWWRPRAFGVGGMKCHSTWQRRETLRQNWRPR